MKMSGKQLLQMSAPVLMCMKAIVELSFSQSNAVNR